MAGTHNPRGIDFVRVCIARAVADGDPLHAATLASARWGANSRAALATKAAIGAGATASGSWGAEMVSEFGAAATEFFEVIAETSIVGRMAGIRTVPLRTRILTSLSGATAYWVGEGKPKPLSRLTFAADNLAPLKIAALSVATVELLTSTDPAAEGLIRRDMLRAAVETLDVAFTDPDNAGVADEKPASVTSGVVALPSSGNATEDLTNLILAFDGDLASAYIVVRPEMAASLAGIERPNLGPRGGDWATIPVIPSRSAPVGAIILVDADGIALGEGEADARVSRYGSVEMADAPNVGATAKVSLWQSNAVGILVERVMNWAIVRSGSVAMIENADYLGTGT